MIILAGDIGGTHSRLALVNSNNTKTELINTAQFRNFDFTNASDLLKTYLSSCKNKPEVACLAIAAPVPNDSSSSAQNISLTNLSWNFNSQQLAQELSLNKLQFINDFSGLPYITEHLPKLISACDLQNLQKTKEPDRNYSIEILIGAGTGLGCVVAHKSKQGLRVLNSEAGHSDISGAQQQLRDIIQYLKKNSIPVCWESLLSGLGLERLHAFVSGGKIGQVNAKEITKMASEDLTSNEHHTLELFLHLTGIFSRNMALCCLPDKLYLVGNIYRIVFDIIPVEFFLQGFHDTTQHHRLLKSISITLIKDTQIGLKGAVAYAQQNLI